MAGGHTLADLLFGQVSPSGRPAFTSARDSSHYPDFNREATQSLMRIGMPMGNSPALAVSRLIEIGHPNEWRLKHSHYRMWNERGRKDTATLFL